MKIPFIFSFCLIVGMVIVQLFGTINEVVYCGEIFTVPENCRANSQSDLKCSTYSIQWLHTSKRMLESQFNQLMKQLEQRNNLVDKKKFECLSMNEHLYGFVLTYKSDRYIEYRTILSGNINGQPLILILSMQEEPSNDTLPEFLKQLVFIGE